MNMNLDSCIRRCSIASVLLALLAGCAGRAAIYTSNPALRKTSAQFAADAAKRHPYKADAPRGGAIAGRTQIEYMFHYLEVVNLSDAAWDNFEVWLNQKYVVFVPKLEKGQLERLNFPMFFDDSGVSFSSDMSKGRIEKVEIYNDGKMYDVTKQLAD